MKAWFALYRKELQHYFYSLLSYIFVVVFLVTSAWLYWKNVFLVGQTSMRDFFVLLPWFFLFLMPALSMRLWTEEKRSGTTEKLFTFPLTDLQAVLAKFSGAMTFLGIVLILSLPIPLTLSNIGNLDWGPVIGSYIGAWLLGGAYLALGQWISGLTNNQIVAFLLTIAAAFGFILIGLPVMEGGNSVLGKIFYTLSTQTHFLNLSKGVIDLRDVVYYVSFIGIFLFLNAHTLLKRKHALQRTAQTLLVIGIIVLGNIFLNSVVLRWDLTDTKQFTLSQASKDIVNEVSDPITIKVLFSQELPQNLLALRQDVGDLIQEYQRVGKDTIIVEYIDPKQDTQAANEAQTYGIPEIQFNVVGDESLAVSTGYAGIVILYQNEHQAIPVVQDTATLEYDLTAAIYKMSSENAPKIGILTGLGEANTFALQQMLEKQYTVNEVTLEQLATTDVKNLIVVAPTKELTDKDKYLVDQFVMKGGNLITFIDGVTIDPQSLQAIKNPTNFRDILIKYGVTVNQDIVADAGSAATLPFGSGSFSVLREYPFWPQIIGSGLNSESPITQQIQAIMLAWPSSLTIQANDTIEVTELIRTTDQSFSVKDATSIDPESITPPADGALASQLVAVLLSGTIQSMYADAAKPADVDSSSFVGETKNSRMFIMSNAQFITDEMLQQSPENALIALNAVDVLAQDDSLAAVRSRSALNRPLEVLDDTQKAVIRYTNTFYSLGLVILLAGIMYLVRKYQAKKALEHYA